VFTTSIIQLKIITPFLFLLATLGNAEGAKYLSISQIQGSDHRSEFEGSEATTDGIVTRVYQDGFIIQTKQPDASSETSDALYVFQKDTVVKIGNELRVMGVVEEYSPGGEDSYNLSLTQIRAETVKQVRSKAPLPKPIVLNYLLPSFPKVIKQPGSDFDPKKNALDFWESMEHMRVSILNATVVGPDSSYDEIAISVPQARLEPATNRGGVKLTEYASNPPKILISLDQNNTNHYSVGDQIKDAIHGTVNYSFGNYKIGSSKAIGPPTSKNFPPSSSEPFIPDSALKLATFNVENLYPGLPDEKFESLARIIIHSLKSPDILALQEIHDNSGPENNQVVDASETLTKLVEFIKSAGGPKYHFIQINPQNNSDGGWPGANIRNAFLYRDSIQLGDNYLLEDSSFNTEKSRGYSGSRKPLVAFFKSGDQRMIFMNCHLRSKGGDSSPYGSLSPAVRFSESQRIPQTTAIRSHVDLLRKKHPEAGIIVLGDMNDYEFSPAIDVLTRGKGLVNLVDSIPLSESYTYVFQGFSQILDHILVSPEMAHRMSAYIPHVNADLSEGLRASDHDPILAWITLP
jgi:uncharacterized protein